MCLESSWRRLGKKPERASPRPFGRACASWRRAMPTGNCARCVARKGSRSTFENYAKTVHDRYRHEPLIGFFGGDAGGDAEAVDRALELSQARPERAGEVRLRGYGARLG